MKVPVLPILLVVAAAGYLALEWARPSGSR
jgi:hypothetical protein